MKTGMMAADEIFESFDAGQDLGETTLSGF
jgi:hypothetical protein